jgi:predicted TIM-barrel fold metal-dependent hydrolase
MQVPKIDGHMHYYSARSSLIEHACFYNFRLIAIHVDFKSQEWPDLEKQKTISVKAQSNFPFNYAYVDTLPLPDKLTKQQVSNCLPQLEEIMNEPTIGIKIWKNVGMNLQKKNGQLLMINDDELFPLFRVLEECQFPLLAHCGEPRNCWLPIDEMTVLSDREYYQKHPQFHMYLQDQFPSYQDQIDARDRMLDQHPELRFVGAHLGSCEWDVEEVARRLDLYPHMSVDLAERVCHLQHQASKDPEKVRHFLIKYQDRLIYASDFIFSDLLSDEEQFEEINYRWNNHWRFFTEDDQQQSKVVQQPFEGMALPREVIDRIYFENALKWYPRLQNRFKR